MNRKKHFAFSGFVKKNGFYIAMVMFVAAGAIASYAAVMSIIDLPAAPEEQAKLIQNEPQQPVVVAPVPEPEPEPEKEPEAEETLVSVPEPLMPVYTRPLQGEVTNAFSGSELVKSATMNDWRTHNGVDYSAAVGDKVTAIYSGEVTRAEKDALWGNIIELKLETGYHVLYANLAAFDTVKVGQRISQGDILGAVGSTALVESGELPHLHLEVKSGSKFVDPESLF
ncbi:MAG: M23 family metallopeptidase [Oscillospiraceae bacterium]